MAEYISDKMISLANQLINVARRMDSTFAKGKEDISLDNCTNPDFLAKLLLLCRDYEGSANKPVSDLEDVIKQLIKNLK